MNPDFLWVDSLIKILQLRLPWKEDDTSIAKLGVNKMSADFVSLATQLGQATTELSQIVMSKSAQRNQRPLSGATKKNIFRIFLKFLKFLENFEFFRKFWIF